MLVFLEEAFAGGKADASASFKAHSTGGVGSHAQAGAFAGAQAEGEVHSKAAYTTFSIGGSAKVFGVGAALDLRLARVTLNLT